MTITKVIAYLITIAMVSTIFWAQNQVSVFDSIIPSLPWGVVSLVDLYAGFILVGIWIFYKEKTVSALVWIFFLMTLGNLTTAIYVIYSLNKSKGNITKFFMGKNSESFLKLSSNIRETSLTLTLSPWPISFIPSSIIM